MVFLFILATIIAMIIVAAPVVFMQTARPQDRTATDSFAAAER
jgi:hypothetical protein